jgi:hypothetical protein
MANINFDDGIDSLFSEGSPSVAGEKLQRWTQRIDRVKGFEKKLDWHPRDYKLARWAEKISRAQEKTGYTIAYRGVSGKALVKDVLSRGFVPEGGFYATTFLSGYKNYARKYAFEGGELSGKNINKVGYVFRVKIPKGEPIGRVHPIGGEFFEDRTKFGLEFTYNKPIPKEWIDKVYATSSSGRSRVLAVRSMGNDKMVSVSMLKQQKTLSKMGAGSMASKKAARFLRKIIK